MDLAELIASIDIVEYISQFVDLQEKNGEWWGLSPFSNEKTPSFSVRSDPPFYYDYSAGGGGNVYSFVKRYNKCSNHQAAEILKKYAGCEGDVFVRHERMAATNDCKRFMRRQNTYKKQSAPNKIPENCMEKYEKRADKLAVWESEGISRDSLDKFQVRYDAFSDRLVYPIHDMSGKIVNIGGRTLDPRWKERGLRKYTYFFNWCNGGINTLYGLYENLKAIKKSKEVIIFEGCKSVLLADTWGVHNTAAILTSHLSASQMKILARLGCTVVFGLDKEISIREDKNIQKLKKYVNVKYIWDKNNLTDEKDAPVDKGKEVFSELYKTRLTYR